MSATTTETCRWLIDTTFELQTPMHLGTGQSEAEKSANADNEETWVAGIVLDHQGRAAIPGASLKGALRALAEREDLLSAELIALLGAEEGNSTTAGLAEFRYATATHEVEEIRRPHVAIDRVTGTAMDKKLFQTRLIPAGTRFSQRILLHRASQAEVAALVALLQGAGQDATFTLGAHASQGLGALRLCGQPQIKSFGPAEAKNWLEQGGSARWEDKAVSIDNLPASETWPTTEQGPRPSLPLQLVFSSPFLVKGGVKERDGHDVTVPMRQGEKVILPASSLRGRLRSQAERILRTLGLKVPQGHDARPWRQGEAHTDLAALLFGSAGWRAIVGASECLDTAEKSRLKTQELLAIDRFTGGGKDGAKFSIEAAECPTLAGQLHLDVHRLKQAGDACWPALGLFTLVLRDLAEGDIAFGHGIAKGYGQCQEKQVLAAWESLLQAQFPEQADPVAQALAELRKQIKQDAVVCEEPFTDVKNVEFGPLNIPPANNDVTNSFLNPYHFIPFGKPDANQWTTPEKLQSERGHDRYQGLSGHISCQLTTKTPLFIGASRKKGDTEAPANLDGYEFQNKRAIPATSLRGMISSLFESISASNLRQLTRDRYTVRDQKRKKHPVEVVDLLQRFDSNLLPLGFPERKEKRFSPVELLFGVVEDKQSDSKRGANTPTLALAGRVVIGIGAADDDIKTEKAVTLKELSSPKPPSPAMYIRRRDGNDYVSETDLANNNNNYVSKADLAENSSKYTLRGRKTYLHAWREQGQVVKLNDQGLRNDQQGREPWVSKYDGKEDDGHKRRVKVEPIAAGQSFSFHIDFHNLSEDELKQLCAALYPDRFFEHRLGMGRPLGLGSVKIEINEIQLVDRKMRYAKDKIDSPRTHYLINKIKANSLAAYGMKIALENDMILAIRLLGNPEIIGMPVHYPQNHGKDIEEEHFEWFRSNDNAFKKNALSTISATNPYLQPLTRMKPKDKKTSNYQPSKNRNRNGR